MKAFIKLDNDSSFQAIMCPDEWLVERVIDEIDGMKKDFCISLSECLIDCESPIEQLLSLRLWEMGLSFNNWNPFIEVSQIANNQNIICKNGKKYRLDFYFIVNYKNQETKYFGIECDGHDYHEKTKEQVIYNNQRERDLQGEGIELIRFSGTEIYKSPYKCAEEVKKIILSNCKYVGD